MTLWKMAGADATPNGRQEHWCIPMCVHQVTSVGMPVKGPAKRSFSPWPM